MAQTTMKMNRIATMAMIASAINETTDNPGVSYRDQLVSMTVPPQRDALIFTTQDGSRFKVTVEAI